MCVGTRVYSLEDVGKHNTSSDCWVVVHGRVYDVTSFVPRHPGGDLIFVNAGGDVSHLFDSYHLSPRASKVLDKYEIGVLDPVSATKLMRYEQQGEADTFYVELKRRVAQYFSDTGLDPRFSTSLYIKAVLIVAMLVGSAWLAFFGSASYSAAVVAAAALGFAMAEVGISIQHDANHGAFSKNRKLCRAAGLTLDAVGASSFVWRAQHVVGHHAFTNVATGDPDIRVAPDGSDVRRVAPQQPRAAHHALQHVYLGALYGLLAAKSIFVDDFAAVLRGAVGPVAVGRRAPHEGAALWCGKATFALWFLVAPVAAGVWPLLPLCGLWTVALLVCGWTLALMFQVAHVVDAVDFIEVGPDGTVSGSWAAQQLATTADFAHGSFLWLHVSGGLNYQAVHHLFPGVAHTHYPALAPIVLRAAREAGLAYAVFPSFAAALASHFRHLSKMGSTLGMQVPSLATVG